MTGKVPPEGMPKPTERSSPLVSQPPVWAGHVLGAPQTTQLKHKRTVTAIQSTPLMTSAKKPRNERAGLEIFLGDQPRPSRNTSRPSMHGVRLHCCAKDKGGHHAPKRRLLQGFHGLGKDLRFLQRGKTSLQEAPHGPSWFPA